MHWLRFLLLSAAALMLPALSRSADDPPKQDKAAPAAADLKKAIQDEIDAFKKKQTEWQNAMTEARKEQPPRRLDPADRPKAEVTAKRILALVEKQPESPAALVGLNWITTQPGMPAPWMNPAVDLLLKHHINDDAAAATIQRLAERPDMQRVVDAALESKSKQVQGAAHFGAGMTLARKVNTTVSNAKLNVDAIKQRYEEMIAANNAKLAKTEGEAEKKTLEQNNKRLEAALPNVLESATKRKADAEKDMPHLSEMKKDALSHLEKAMPILKSSDSKSVFRCQGAINDLSGKLDPGVVAMEITAEDVDGKNFKLSDYRGKVILLDFWGHW